jgi:hypothetical protein
MDYLSRSRSLTNSLTSSHRRSRLRYRLPNRHIPQRWIGRHGTASLPTRPTSHRVRKVLIGATSMDKRQNRDLREVLAEERRRSRRDG